MVYLRETLFRCVGRVMHRLETEQRMSCRILVINDDQSILELFQLLLESEGYEVLLSKVAFEEVRQIEHQHADLIILDFKLGTHADGFLLLQKIRMYPPTTAIPSSFVQRP